MDCIIFAYWMARVLADPPEALWVKAPGIPAVVLDNSVLSFLEHSGRGKVKFHAAQETTQMRDERSKMTLHRQRRELRILEEKTEGQLEDDSENWVAEMVTELCVGKSSVRPRAMYLGQSIFHLQHNAIPTFHSSLPSSTLQPIILQTKTMPQELCRLIGPIILPHKALSLLDAFNCILTRHALRSIFFLMIKPRRRRGVQPRP